MTKSPQRRQSETFTQEMIERFRTWAPEAAANAYDERLRAIERGYAQTFTELGLIMVESVTRGLWKLVVLSNGEHPHTWTAWVTDCMPVSAASAFAAKTVAEVLVEIPVEEREQIPRSNLETMAKMSSAVAKSPEVRSRAKSLKPNKFLEWVESEHPEQHIESRRPMRLKPERSQRTNIDTAIEMIMAIEGFKTREEALDGLATYYIDAHPNWKRNQSEETEMVQ